MRLFAWKTCGILFTLASVAVIALVGWWALAPRLPQQQGALQVFYVPRMVTVQSLAFSPDGQWLAAGLANDPAQNSQANHGAVYVWDRARHGHPPESQLPAHDYWNSLNERVEKPLEFIQCDDPVHAVTFSPDSTTLVVATGDIGWDPWSTSISLSDWRQRPGSRGHIFIWDTQAEEFPAAWQPGSGAAAARKPDGVRSWKKVGDLELPGAAVFATISPDGKSLAALSIHGLPTARLMVTIWALPARTKEASFELNGCAMNPATFGPYHPLAFSPDSQLLAAVGDKWWHNDPATVVVWDRRTGAPMRSMKVDSSPATGIWFDHEGKGLIVSADAVLRWDMATWKEQRIEMRGRNGVVPMDDNVTEFWGQLSSRNGIGRGGLWRAKDDASEPWAMFISTCYSATRYVRQACMTLSTDGTLLAAGGRTPDVCVWKIPGRPRSAAVR